MSIVSSPLAPIVFDAYGTLFDPGALAEPLESRFPGRGVELARAWRATQLRHTWLRTLMGAFVDFDAITRDAIEQVLQEAGLPADVRLTDDLLARYRELPPYPDVRPALAAVEPDRRVAILTNGARSTVEATVRAAGLADRIPVVLSADTVRVYKPAPAVYRMASDHFGVEPGEVLFVSGNAWDCAGAATFGLQAIRIRRRDEVAERVGAAPLATIDSLHDIRSVLDGTGF